MEAVMKKIDRFFLCLLMIVILMLASPLSVFAQDPLPTDEPTPEGGTDPVEFLVTSEGDVIPLDSPTAENLPSANIAQYCIYDYVSGELLGGCEDWYSSITSALSAAASETLGSGIALVINLAAATINENVSIDGTDFYVDSFLMRALTTSETTTTLYGDLDFYDFDTYELGLDGGSGSMSIFGQLVFDDNWADTTISNVNVSNYEGSGIVLAYNDGDIILNNVNSSDNYGDGLEVFYGAYDPIPSGYMPSYGDLTISNSIFNGNYADGIDVYTYGDVSLVNVETSGNYDHGVYINTYGDISLDRVEATDNNMGAGLWNYAGYADLVNPLPITIDDSIISVSNSTFSHNYYYGLGISNYYGGTYLSNVDASFNGGFLVPSGFSAEAVGGGGPLGVGIVIDGYYQYINLDHVTANYNYGYGIIASGGAIDANYVEANHNIGAPLEFLYEPTAGSTTPTYYPANYLEAEYVHVNCSQFNQNDGTGLFVYGYDVALDNTEVDYNTQANLVIDAEYSSVNTTNIPCPLCDCFEETAPTLSDIVIQVMTDEQRGSASLNGLQGLVFKLMQELQDGEKEMLARVTVPASAALAGTVATFSPIAEGNPAPLPDGMTYLGPAFSITFTAGDGSELNNVNAYMELLFKVDPGLVVPAGSHLAVAHYNQETGNWDALSTGFSGEYAYAYSALTGAYALVLMSD
jgi:hypothetical protein